MRCSVRRSNVKNRSRTFIIIKKIVNEQSADQRFSLTYSGYLMLGRALRKQRWRSMPSHSCTPTMPNMKKTKKHNNKTLPSMGRVSSSSITSIRIPVGGVFVKVTLCKRLITRKCVMPRRHRRKSLSSSLNQDNIDSACGYSSLDSLMLS